MHAPASDDGILELQGYARWLGRAFTVIAAAMSFSFGYALGGSSFYASTLIGTGFAGITVLVAILLSFVDVAWRHGARSVALGLAGFWCVCVGAEYFSHVGFTVGHRATNVQAAVHQDSRHDDARKAVLELERSLAKLEAKYDWSRSVDPPAAYEARIETAAKAVEVETARGGCKDKCVRLKAAHASLLAEQAIAADRIAVAEEIKATRRDLDKARATAGSTAKGDSPAYTQTAMVAQLATQQLRPTEAALHWAGISIGAFVSLVFTGASAVCNFIAFAPWGGPRRRMVPENPGQPRTMLAAPADSALLKRLHDALSRSPALAT